MTSEVITYNIIDFYNIIKKGNTCTLPQKTLEGIFDVIRTGWSTFIYKNS